MFWCLNKLHQLVLQEIIILRKKIGCTGDAVVRALASHQCGPGLIPRRGIICKLSLLLVLVFALRGFSLGTPVFPSPQKPTFPNSNSIWRVSLISALAKYSRALIQWHLNNMILFIFLKDNEKNIQVELSGLWLGLWLNCQRCFRTNL